MPTVKYYLSVSDGSYEQTFDVVRDEDELPISIHYFVGLAYKTYKACVHIEVDVKSKYAVLQGVQTDSECSMEGDLQSIHMLVKGALKHVAKKHTLKYFTLDDKAEKHLGNKSIAITPRLLLQGKEGWYQHHFGAVPTQDTYRILQSLSKHKDKIKRNLSITTQDNWGSDNEIVTVAEKIIPNYANAIFGTSWIIQREIVDKYNVTIKEVQYGGANKYKTAWTPPLWYMTNASRYIRKISTNVAEKQMRIKLRRDQASTGSDM